VEVDVLSNILGWFGIWCIIFSPLGFSKDFFLGLGLMLVGICCVMLVKSLEERNENE
jgi:ABC-type multidrug transport system permease subunit